jgi:hypothetical protein
MLTAAVVQGRTAEWVASTPPGKHRLGSPAKGKARGTSDSGSDNASSTDMEDQQVMRVPGSCDATYQ